MKRKRLKVVRRGTVLEGTLPKALQRHGPKWLKNWPKVQLIRSRSKENPGADTRRRLEVMIIDFDNLATKADIANLDARTNLVVLL